MIHQGEPQRVVAVTYEADLCEILGSLLFEQGEPLMEVNTIYVHTTNEITTQIVPAYADLKTFKLLDIQPEVVPNNDHYCWSCITKSLNDTRKAIVNAHPR